MNSSVNIKVKIVTEATFASGDRDYQSALTKFKDLDYDAIVMPGYYTETGIITKQARDLGLINQSLDLTDSVMRNLLSLRGKRMLLQTSTMYQCSTNVALSDKASGFIEAYKPTTLTQICFAALAYDSVYMIAEASKDAKTSVIADNLADLKRNFVEVTGKMTIIKDHNPNKAALMVKKR